MAHLQLDTTVMQYVVQGKPASAEKALHALATGAPLLVLMHGLGSHEGDLIQLAQYLPQEFVCVSPRAPLSAYPPHDGYSWFPLSLQPGGVTPEQANDSAVAAAQSVWEWLGQLHAQLIAQGSSLGKIALMGFSQGGVMVTTLLRLHPQRFMAGVNCSGFIAPVELAGDAELANLRPPLFWGRDHDDPVISAAARDMTAAWAAQHTALVSREYPGIEHSISLPELRDINDFLQAVL